MLTRTPILQYARFAGTIRTEAQGDSRLGGMTWEIDGSTVKTAGRDPNRHGPTFTNSGVHLSAQYLVLAMRETGPPLSTVLVAAIAQSAAVNELRHDHACGDAEDVNLRLEMQDRRIAEGALSEADIEAEVRATIDRQQAELVRLKLLVEMEVAGRKKAEGQLRAIAEVAQVRKNEWAAEQARLARERALGGLYRFPEAGDGKWKLRDILAAFKGAEARVGARDLHRQPTTRVRLANGRLVREVRRYGTRISTGRGQNAYTIFFADELVSAVGIILRKHAVHPVKGAQPLLQDCQRLDAAD